jgi:hypothetical protein
MPIAVKPCEGRFSDELQVVLTRNRDRDQWANHACEICGVTVGAKIDKGRWVPEQHWPSVKYQPRNGNEKKQRVSASNPVLDDEAVLAASGSGRIQVVRS